MRVSTGNILHHGLLIVPLFLGSWLNLSSSYMYISSRPPSVRVDHGYSILIVCLAGASATMTVKANAWMAVPAASAARVCCLLDIADTKFSAGPPPCGSLCQLLFSCFEVPCNGTCTLNYDNTMTYCMIITQKISPSFFFCKIIFFMALCRETRESIHQIIRISHSSNFYNNTMDCTSWWWRKSDYRIPTDLTKGWNWVRKGCYHQSWDDILFVSWFGEKYQLHSETVFQKSCIRGRSYCKDN